MTTAPVAGRLPEANWQFMPLATDNVWMAQNEALGCWIWLHGAWHECYPMSSNPLTYDKEWYRRG